MPRSFELPFEDKIIRPSYQLGYIFGLFVGDGSTQVNEKGGIVHWALGAKEVEVIAKLQTALVDVFGLTSSPRDHGNHVRVTVYRVALAKLFISFGKKTSKGVPNAFWCSDMDYVRGLYDGLLDSDGHINNDTWKLTNTSSLCMEQYFVCHWLIFGYFPSVSYREPSTGGLDCNIENCNESYRATSFKNEKHYLTNSHQIIVPLSFKEFGEVETYDIEVDDEEHSFIANNVIVHNSMGTKSFIVQGKGNPDSFCSCSHGAGRKMSRTAARKKYTKKDLENQTKGVECRKDRDVIDELPSAYKNLDHVMANQEDLVEAIFEIKQVLCVKGA
jgi:hypothetical protein